MQLDPVAQLVGIHAMLQGKLRNRDPGLKGGCNQPFLPDRIIPTLPIAQNTHHSWRNRNRVIQCHCVSVSTVSVVDTLDQPDVSEQVQRFARLRYAGEDRARIIRRARARDRHFRSPANLLLTSYGTALSGKRLTALFAKGFADAGLKGSFHWLRHTFAMVMLARLQQQARSNPDLNPLKILQVLMGHRSIATTAIYLRCVEVHDHDLSESLAWLYGELIPDAK